MTSQETLLTAVPPTKLRQIFHDALINRGYSCTPDDEIWACGKAVLLIVPARPDDALRLAHEKLHSFPYHAVPTCWRRLYVEAALWKAHRLIVDVTDTRSTAKRNGEQQQQQQQRDWVAEVVRILDMAVILTGAPGREETLEKVMTLLAELVRQHDHPYGGSAHEDDQSDLSQPRPKRRRTSNPPSSPNDTSPHNRQHLPSVFPSHPTTSPKLRYPMPRRSSLSHEDFQSYLSASSGSPQPLIITNAIDHWPALHERPWRSPQYLLDKTVGGRRLVPIETGRSYTDEGWGQKIITFKDFMETYMLRFPSCTPGPLQSQETPSSDGEENTAPPAMLPEAEIAYLAQHDLFAQIPSLRLDISIPEYCYTTPPSPPPTSHVKPQTPLDEPLLNAWFGPAGTISPLHTDPYHNILTQVVGKKYIRLYPPREGERVYPRGRGEDGVDMSNTSEVDVAKFMTLFESYDMYSTFNKSNGNRSNRVGDGKDEDEDQDVNNVRREFEEKYPLFKEAMYIEGILSEGECLYIPVGWWHFIRSLSPSFSVSFWWN